MDTITTDPIDETAASDELAPQTSRDTARRFIERGLTTVEYAIGLLVGVKRILAL